jgi:hypothetical protein
MKSNMLIPILWLSASSMCVAVPEPPEIILGVSPWTPSAEWAKQQGLLQRFVVADCPNGSRVVVMDGWELRVICAVQLPKLAYDSPSARAPRAAAALAALKQWGDHLGANQPPRGLKDSSAIRLPELLQAASDRPAPAGRILVLLASPFCIVPNEESFSMVEARYPSDAHLARPLAESPYGIAEKRGRLAKTEVLWAYQSENIWSSQLHRERVTRWWSLFIAGQGGVLAAFNSDAPQTLFAAARPNHYPVGQYAVNSEDADVVMHAADGRQVPLKLSRNKSVPLAEPQPAPAVPPSQASAAIISSSPPPPAPAPPENPPLVSKPEPEQKLLVAESDIKAPAEIPIPAAGNIGVAAVWQAAPGTDIDLWVAARPGLPEAYWHRPHVEHVRYFRDIRTAQSVKDNAQWRQAWEYVEIEKARLDEPSVWLNVYEAAGPVSGIIRIQFNGRVVDRPFSFNVRRGNKGQDSNPSFRVRSPYWQRISLADFFPNEFSQQNWKAQ